MARLVLLLPLAVPARAEELRLVYERHKETSRQLEHAFHAVARERLSYPGATDPEAHIARWGALLDSAGQLWGEQERLAKEHRDEWRRRMMTEFAGAVSRATHGEKPIKNARSSLYEEGKREEVIEGLQKGFREVYGGETAVYRQALAQLAERRQRERDKRRGLWGALAVVGAAAGVGLLMRRKTVIIRLPGAGPGAPRLIAGNLTVKGLIGRGAMGEVFEAVDNTIGRRVALKRLRPELLANPADLELLLAEARTVASLKHDNLVSIYSVERQAGQVYLAFEFVDGSTLARLLEERRRLPWPEALPLFRGVCAALGYAHDRRVIHRDLKPANIMIARTGEVKVMDFGIAFTARKSISRLTRAAAWGTPPYMAPEQELGGVSSAVDLFAATVCLYEMLTGELPFKGPNFLAQKREGLHGPPSALVPGLPKGADAFFDTALAPEPSRRFPTAAALLAAAEAAA